MNLEYLKAAILFCLGIVGLGITYFLSILLFGPLGIFLWLAGIITGIFIIRKAKRGDVR